MDPEATSLESPSSSEFIPEPPPLEQEEIRRRRNIIIAVSVAVVLFLALLITGIIYLALPDTNTERIRDIMIIVIAIEFMFLGFAMLILIIQLAILINLLQNEIIPIVESTNETANTLRGTAVFLSDNLSEPVIKLNQYLAGIMRLTELIGLTRKRR